MQLSNWTQINIESNKRENMQLENIILLRVISILLVVIGHATYVFTGNWGAKMPINPLILIVLCKVIYTFHMPVL